QHYFGGKRGLFLAVMEAGISSFDESVHRLEVGSDLAKDLRQVLLREIDRIWERREFVRAVVGQSFVDPQFGATDGQRLYAERLDVLKDRLREHQRGGRIPLPCDLEAVADLLSAVIHHLGVMLPVVYSVDRKRVRGL